MESENVGVCKRSGSSRLDSPLHQRFFYGLSLQLVDTEKTVSYTHLTLPTIYSV